MKRNALNTLAFSLSLLLALCLTVTVIFAGDTANPNVSGPLVTDATEVIPVCVSADGTYTLVTGELYNGLALVDQATGKNTKITDGRNAGYYATISPDNRYVCFKGFKPVNNNFLQAAMLYDIKNNKTIALSDWAPLVGTPAVAANGTMAYTLGNKLIVLDAALKPVETFDLKAHVNLLDLTKDSKNIAYCNGDDQLVVLNRATKQHQVITDGKNGFWGPKFSPNGDKILLSTIDGMVGYSNLKTGWQKIGRGKPLGWVNNDQAALLDKTINEPQNSVLKTNLVITNLKDLSKSVIQLNDGDAQVSLNGVQMTISRSHRLESGNITNEKQLGIFKRLEAPEFNKDTTNNDSGVNAAGGAVEDDGTHIYVSGIPYIHQVYDTPNNFDGNWACGATSALMAIQFYKVLPTHPITCSYPSSHTSNYGWYVSNVYTKGRTFNIYSKDPDGNSFAGGYGYITQKNWENTKSHMVEYIKYHGRSSAVDWSPSWSKLVSEVKNNHPFVVLTSLTSSGHYITTLGYFKKQHTALFKDPYGNKNLGYKNYKGNSCYYDWPGYNNGYANLNTVHCFIYCR